MIEHFRTLGVCMSLFEQVDEASFGAFVTIGSRFHTGENDDQVDNSVITTVLYVRSGP